MLDNEVSARVVARTGRRTARDHGDRRQHLQSFHLSFSGSAD
jgi:hypothetical protein